MALLDDIRGKYSWAAGKSDYEIADVFAKKSGRPVSLVASDLGVVLPVSDEDRNPISAGFSSGTDSAQGMGYSGIAAVGDLAGFEGVKNWGLRGASKNMYEAQANGRPDLERIEDQDIGTALPFAGYQISKQIPNIAAAIGFGAVLPEVAVPMALSRAGALLPKLVGGGGLRAGASAGEKALAEAAGKDFAKTLVGGTATEGSMGAGSMYQESLDAGNPDAAGALLKAIPYGVTGAMTPAMLKNLFVRGAGFSGGTGERVAKSILLNATGEGAVEGVQNEMEMGFNPNLSEEEIASRRLNSIAVGGIAGGAFGGLGGLRRNAQAYEPINIVGKTEPTMPDAAPISQVGKPLGLPNRPHEDMVAFPDGSVGTKAQVDAYMESVPEDQRVAVRSRLMGFNDLTLPTVPAAVAVEKPTDPDDTSPTGPSTALPDWQYDVPPPKEVVGKNTKKVEAYTAAAQALKEGVIDEVQFNEFANQIAMGRPERVGIRVAKELKAIREGAQNAGMSDLQMLQLPVQPAATETTAAPESVPNVETQVQGADQSQGIDLAAIANQLAPQQRKIFDALVMAVQNNETDQIISGDGKLQFQAIAERAGLTKRGAAQAAINQTVKKVSNLAGIDVKSYLADRTKQVRKVEPAMETQVGLSPAVQGSVVEDGAIFGDDDSTASMGMIKSVGATDTDLGSVVSNSTRAQDVIQDQGTEILAEAGAIDRGNVIVPEGDVTPSENAILAAAENRQALLDQLLNAPESRQAMNDWDHETIKLVDFDPNDMIAYLSDYFEAVNADGFDELTGQQQVRVIEDIQVEIANTIKRRLFNENDKRLQGAVGRTQGPGAGNANTGANRGIGSGTIIERDSAEDSGNPQLGGTGVETTSESQDEIRNIAAGDAADGITLAAVGRPLTKEEISGGGIARGLNAFYQAGLAKVLLDMKSFTVADQPDKGLFDMTEQGQFIITIQEKLVNSKDADEIAHVVRHELSHGLDYVLGWGLSEHPDLEVSVLPDGELEYIGAVAKEIAELRATETKGYGLDLATYLGYPLNREVHGGLDAFTTQAEMFAQLQAAWMTTGGRATINKFLPRTSIYLEAANDYAKKQLQEGNTITGSKGDRSKGANIRKPRDVLGGYKKTSDGEGNQTRETSESLASRGAALGGGNNDYFERAQSMGSDAFKGMGNFLKEINPRLLTSNQLVEQYGDKITTLKDYVKTQNEMGAFASQLREATHKLLERWGTYAFRNKVQNNLLMSVMHDATQAGIHPDLGFNDELNSHLTVAELDKYDSLRARYDVLPAEAQSLYQESKKLLANNWQLRKNIFADVVTSAYAPRITEAVKSGNDKQVRKLEKERDAEIASHAKQIKELKGPYFPLMRFGDYIVVAESNELLSLRKVMEKAEPAEYTKMAARAAELEKNEKHYVVEAYESRIDMERRKQELTGEGFNTYDRKAEVYAGENRPVNAVALDKINDALAEGFDKTTASKLKDMMTSMYISALPEHHALQRQIKRKGVAGADTNMMRSFAEAIERDSFYLSRMRYAKDLAKHLNDMRKETHRMGVDADNVYNNVVDRATADYKYESTPFLSALARLSSIFHLGISPAFLLTNMTQPWFISVPQLAGAHGMTKTLSAMRSGWADAARIISQGKGGTVFNLAEVDLSKVSNPLERAMLQRLRDVNKLESNQLLDMGALSNGMSPTTMKAWKTFNWATHHIEMTNRISTALATYRLEKARNPNASEDTLIEKAINMVDLTQLDYSNENAAYYMKPGVGLGKLNKIVFQFRKYQQGMIYLLARDAKLAFAGDKEALRSLGYLMGTQLLFAGTTGLPLTAPLLFLAYSAFGDEDDEKGDYETRIRNYAADVLGPDAARVFWKGLPNALGADISGNVGMGGLFKPLPMMAGTDVTQAKRGEDVIKELLFNAAGAPVGMISKWAEAILSFQNGEYNRGIAQMSPRFVAGMVKAKDLADNGVSTRSGTQVMTEDQFDGWDITLRAAGFNPTSLTEHYTAQSSKENTSRAIQDRRNTLLKQYAVAKLRGEDLVNIQAEIREFNLDHPKVKLDQSALLKAVQSRKKGSDEMDQAGVRFRKNEESLRGIDRFAY